MGPRGFGGFFLVLGFGECTGDWRLMIAHCLLYKKVDSSVYFSKNVYRFILYALA